MNRDDIIRWAREAGFAEWYGTDSPEFLSLIERFAALVAAAEREACAQVCESLYGKLGVGNTSLVLGSLACAAAIRARGQE